MEACIKDNVNDITYMPELTPPSMPNVTYLSCLEGGVNSSFALL